MKAPRLGARRSILTVLVSPGWDPKNPMPIVLSCTRETNHRLGMNGILKAVLLPCYTTARLVLVSLGDGPQLFFFVYIIKKV